MRHHQWSYEDFVFTVENFPKLTLKEIGQQLGRTSKAVTVLLTTVRSFNRQGKELLLHKGYSKHIVGCCSKYYGDKEVAPVVQEESKVSATLQENIESIDVLLNTLKGRIVGTIEQVLAESNHIEELKTLKIRVAELEVQLKEFDKYKEAAKTSSVWGVLTRKFGHAQ